MLLRRHKEPVRVTREVTVTNKYGLHARPAAEFVKNAGSFRSEITLVVNGERFDGTSVMEIMRANLGCGAQATLEAYGPDAEAAADRLVELLAKLAE